MTHNTKEEDELINTDNKHVDKLTDFAYRETSLVRHRPKLTSHNLHWSKHNNESTVPNRSTTSTTTRTTTQSTTSTNRGGWGNNMGLVRVQPNEKTTPICTTYLRGIDCTDQYCPKRHDVPKEHTIPVCSFFQKHGQCLKGDKCIFRHVKVNARAVVCPSFSLLGFCDEEQCLMQHVRAGSNGGKSLLSTIR